MEGQAGRKRREGKMEGWLESEGECEEGEGRGLRGGGKVKRRVEGRSEGERGTYCPSVQKIRSR